MDILVDGFTILELVISRFYIPDSPNITLLQCLQTSEVVRRILITLANSCVAAVLLSTH